MNRIRLFVFVVLSVLNIHLLLAVRAPGFIVTNDLDTISGEIKIPIFDSYTGGLSLSGINLEQFHSVLRFRETGPVGLNPLNHMRLQALVLNISQ
jgi:hypothetical protein